MGTLTVGMAGSQGASAFFISFANVCQLLSEAFHVYRDIGCRYCSDRLQADWAPSVAAIQGFATHQLRLNYCATHEVCYAR